MLRLIYGCPGSEKSEYLRRLASDSLKRGKQVILIVPERFSVAAERAVTQLCGDENKMNLEILSFRRLCNRVFREYGGLCYNYAGKGGQMLMMWRALTGVKDKLKAYKKLRLRDAGTIETMLGSIVSFKRAALPAQAFGAAAENKELDPSLQNKLHDLSIIYEEYDRLLHERYDDPEEDLTRLHKLLEDHPFFKNKEVYVDSTAAFTGQELLILRAALRQADSVTAALEFLPAVGEKGKTDRRAMLEKMRWCESLLRQEAKEAGCGQTQVLAVFERPNGKNEDLAALEKWLYADGAQAYAGEERSMVLSSCADIYEECKTAAARILRDVYTGGRYEDHCVVVRDLDMYAGLLDRVFEANGIPFSSAAKMPLSSRAAVRTVRCALHLLTGGFRTDDLLSYVRTGMTDLSDDLANDLEEYLVLWQIEGTKRWLSGADFAMNPDGHTGDWTDDGREKLARVNEAKKILTQPLIQMYDDFSACATVGDYAGVVYEYIENMRLFDKLAAARQDCEKRSEAQEALWHEQTYPALCDALQELYDSAGDMNVSPDGFALMLGIVLDKKKLGSIPAGKDRVLICDAFNLKPGQIRVLHALGLNDGVFPAQTRESGMFTRRERQLLKNLNIDLPGNDERAALDEEYLAYTVLTLPRERLYVTNHKKSLQGAAREPSDLFEDLKRFYARPEGAEETDSEPDEDLLYGGANCFDAAFAGVGRAENEKTAALRGLFARQSALFEKNMQRAPLISLSDRIRADLLSQVYVGDAPYMSQTRLESFLQCPLSYTCKYLLRLSEPRTAEVSGNEIGTIVHEVLQRLIEDGIASGKRFGSYSDREIEEQTSAVLDAQKRKMSGGEQDPQIDRFFSRITDAVTIIALNLRDEFAQSAFEPAFCELSFGGKGGEGDGMPGIRAGKDCFFTITGKVDRVDVFHRDGKTYLRVVDYKTKPGKYKTMTEQQLTDGKKMQMPLYMRALLENKDENYLSKIGAQDGGEVLPAAVVYHVVAFPQAVFPLPADRETPEQALRKSVMRTGLLLDDDEVLRAMDRDLDGTFSPYKPRGRNRMSKDRFLEGLSSIDDTLSQTAEKMRAGDAHSQTENCDFCAMKPICRRVSDVDSDDGPNDGEEGSDND